MLSGLAVAGVGTAAAALHFWRWRRGIARPEVYAGKNETIAQLLSGLPALKQPLVTPIWCSSWWAQLAAHLAFEPLRPQPAVELITQKLTLADGGVCGLAWSKDGRHLAPDAPVVCIFHTVTGTAEHASLRRLCAHAEDHGFRPVVFLRRGHLGEPLATARFHLVGFAADGREQVAAVRKRFPEAPLVALGVSAGTGSVVRMAGEDADASPFKGIVCICPGYQTSTGGIFAKMWPFAKKYMQAGVQQFFLDGLHKDVLDKAALKDPDVAASLQSARTAPDVEAFYESLATLGGYRSVEEMHAATDPMITARNIQVPGLIISAYDDPVCTMAPQYIGDPLFDGGTSARALVLSHRGSHCAFYDGWSGLSVFSGAPNWSERLALDFLSAALLAAGLVAGRKEKGD